MPGQWSNLIPREITHIGHLVQFHARLITHGSISTHNNHWSSVLIRLCTHFHAPPSYADLIFSSALCPDAAVFTSMLKFCSHLGVRSRVFHLFDEMRARSLRPSASVYLELIKAGGAGGDPVHAHVVKLGFLDHDVYVRNAIMDTYAKGGLLDDARRLFDEMPDPTVADWNSMISGYWKWGLEGRARELFNVMTAKNVVTWTTMVTGYAKMGDLEKARRYFDEMPQKNLVSWNAMISGYAQNGLHNDALQLFEEMESSGLQPDEKTWVAVISSCTAHGDASLANLLLKRFSDTRIDVNYFVKTALLQMYAKFGHMVSAREIFDELGMQRSLVTWNSMISAYSKDGDLDSARELFDSMPERDVVSWNTMMGGYAQNGQSNLAIELFREMIDVGQPKPDELTIASVLSACGHLGAMELGNWVVAFLKENQIKLGISGYNALMFMYCRCGSMDDARRLFHEMEIKDVVSYNTLIMGLATHGHGLEALKLLSKMTNEGLDPDRVTYLGILTACSHTGLLEEGWRVFNSIESPSVDHYACMVDLLGRVGELEGARALIHSMPMKPHAGVFGSLLNACRIHKRLDLGEMAANNLFEIEPSNSGNHVLLSNLYASLGRWEDVNRVRQMMGNMGVKKATGWSWVEHKGKVHKFIVGDRSHERSDEIYRLLSELEMRMKRDGYMADESCVLRDVAEEEKEEMLRVHSERLAIGFAILVSKAGSKIRVMKNLRVCWDCHSVIKIISKLEKREIMVRDNNRFHCFIDGQCSCQDYW